MSRPPADTSDAPVRARRRLGRSWPMAAGAAIAAVGLAVGSLTAAHAASGGNPPAPTIEQQAAKVRAADAFDPVNGNNETNLGVLEDQIKHYYGSAGATYPVVGAVTIPSSSSNYAAQMKQIVTDAEKWLDTNIRHYRGAAQPAVVFDIDDTLLNTYDYEIAQQFGYTPASNAVWVNAGAFPAVFDMPQLVSFAASRGYAIFFITGRPQSQTAATVGQPGQRRLRRPAVRAPVPQAAPRRRRT